MNAEVAATFFALLALFSNLATVVLIVARLTGRARGLMAGLDPLRPALAALVAATAMGGSLYFSESAGYPPCEFCWYQRIAMYPLVAVCGVAALRRRPPDRAAATVLAGVGVGLALWHLRLQYFEIGTSCDPTAPCSAIWVEEFGFVTIPYMALSGFLLILALLWTGPKHDEPDAASIVEDDERVVAGS